MSGTSTIVSGAPLHAVIRLATGLCEAGDERTIVDHACRTVAELPGQRLVAIVLSAQDGDGTAPVITALLDRAPAPPRVVAALLRRLWAPDAAGPLLDDAADDQQPRLRRRPIRCHGRTFGQLLTTEPATDPGRPATEEAITAVAGQVALAIAGLRHQRAAEVQTQRAAASTDELERLRAELSALASEMSHDLSEPLRTVRGFVYLLRRDHGEALPPEAEEFLDLIDGGARRVVELVKDVASYMASGAKPEPVDCLEVVRGLLDDLADVLRERGAQVTIRSLPRVRASEADVRTVLEHLLRNAVTFVAPGTRPRVEVSCAHEDGAWRISVTDNGIGIAPEHRDEVFGLFQRPNGDAYEGAGVGLWLCKRIVERRGGRIEFESQPERGTTFHVVLPGADDDEQPTGGAQPSVAVIVGAPSPSAASSADGPRR